jgi:hypothetical protein
MQWVEFSSSHLNKWESSIEFMISRLKFYHLRLECHVSPNQCSFIVKGSRWRDTYQLLIYYRKNTSMIKQSKWKLLISQNHYKRPLHLGTWICKGVIRFKGIFTTIDLFKIKFKMCLYCLTLRNKANKQLKLWKSKGIKIQTNLLAISNDSNTLTI